MSPFLLRDEAYRLAFRDLEERGHFTPFLLLNEGGGYRHMDLASADPDELVKVAAQVLAAEPSGVRAYALVWDGEVLAWEQRTRAVLVLDGDRERDAWLSCWLYDPRLRRPRGNPVMFAVIRSLFDVSDRERERLVLQFPGCRCGNPLSRWSGLKLRLAPWVLLALGLLFFGQARALPTTAAVVVVAGMGIVGAALWLLFWWACRQELRWRKTAKLGNR